MRLRPEEINDLESAAGLRMLHQLLQEPFNLAKSRFLNVLGQPGRLVAPTSGYGSLLRYNPQVLPRP